MTNTYIRSVVFAINYDSGVFSVHTQQSVWGTRDLFKSAIFLRDFVYNSRYLIFPEEHKKNIVFSNMLQNPADLISASEVLNFGSHLIGSIFGSLL